MTLDAPATPGTLLAGRYRVERELGRGGMGVVYLCRDRATGEQVALKRLFRGDAKLDREEVWWFQQEARAVAALDHPVIVRGRDFGVLADGSPFLVMDVAPGRSLLKWLELGAIPWPWPFGMFWSFVDQILGGLAHAHARGVIHGDLKPTNVMIDFAGPGTLPRVAVLDLGLASLMRDTVDHRLDQGARPNERTLRAGAGTPGWMAPEQIRRATPHYGPPTDLYALGSILYHLLAGREPWTGAVDDVLEGHRNQPLPAFEAPINTPLAAAEFVRKLLAKRPWHRFEYAADARRAWAALEPTTPLEAWKFRREPPPPEIELDPLASTPGPGMAARAGASLPPSAPGLVSLRPSPLVARIAERALLRAAAEDVCRDGGPAQKLVIISGEAGVGKSRLAEWLYEHVHERGLMVPLRARYRRIPAPLDGVIGAVNFHFGLEAADRVLVERTLLNQWEIGDDDDDGRTWVAATAEWLRPTPPGTHAPAGPTGKRYAFDTPEARRRVIIRALRKIGETRPLLLWLDDLHLASSRTFETLARLRGEVPSLRVLLVATVRTEAVTLDPQAAKRLEALRELFGGETIELEKLGEADTHALLESSLPLDPAALEAATARSKGNPLYALQLLHAWAKSDRLELQAGRWRVPPDKLAQGAGTTAELWEERLGAIPVELRGAALAASALGGDIPTVVLRELLGQLDIPVAEALSALTRAEILLPEGPGRLRWPHALLQEHLLGRLAEHGDAKLVFRRAADALALHPAAGTRRVVAHRVTNLERAGDEAAIAALVLAFVERSWKRVRDVDATLNDLSRLDRIVSGPTRAAHERWRAEALRHRGDFAEARELAERAGASFAAMGDRLGAAHCERLLGHIDSEQAVQGGRTRVAHALTVFEAEAHTGGQAECEVLLGEIDYLIGDYDLARGELERAEQHFKAAGDTLGRSQCLLLLGLIAQAEGDRARATALLEEARHDFDQLGYRLGVAQCDAVLAHVEHRFGGLRRAIARAGAVREVMRELGNPRGEAAAERLLAMAWLDVGEIGPARDHALAAGAIYDRMGDPWGQVESALLLAQGALAAGKPVAAELVRACRSVALAEAEPAQHLALTLAWLSYSEGRLSEAHEALVSARAAFGDARRSGDHAPSLVARLARFEWPAASRDLLDAWLRELPHGTAS